MYRNVSWGTPTLLSMTVLPILSNPWEKDSDGDNIDDLIDYKALYKDIINIKCNYGYAYSIFSKDKFLSNISDSIELHNKDSGNESQDWKLLYNDNEKYYNIICKKSFSDDFSLFEAMRFDDTSLLPNAFLSAINLNLTNKGNPTQNSSKWILSSVDAKSNSYVIYNLGQRKYLAHNGDRLYLTDKKHDNNAIWNFEDAYEEKIDYLYSIKYNKELTRVPQLNYNLAVSNDLNSTVFSNALFKSVEYYNTLPLFKIDLTDQSGSADGMILCRNKKTIFGKPYPDEIGTLGFTETSYDGVTEFCSSFTVTIIKDEIESFYQSNKGCFVDYNDGFDFIESEEIAYLNTISHEIAHTFGLADYNNGVEYLKLNGAKSIMDYNNKSWELMFLQECDVYAIYKHYDKMP